MHHRESADRVYTIVLEEMSFVGFHGCREDEKKNGNLFTVDLKGRYVGCAGATDSLEDAVNYGRIYDIVKEQMALRSNLLENIAQRITDAVAAEFPAIFALEVRVSKRNPPVKGPCEWSRITVEWERK